MKPLIILAVAFCCITPQNTSADDLVIGSVKATRGTTLIVRGEHGIIPTSGTKLQQKDLLKTGDDGTLSVVFKDDTLLAIGPGSQIELNEFRFSPAEGKLSFITKMLRGTAAYMSGIIAKLAPESVRFETPVAHIGIRGTTFVVHVDSPKE
jgi:hypothetical protein